MKITEKDIGRKVSVTGEIYNKVFKRVVGRICKTHSDSDRVGVSFKKFINGHMCDGASEDSYRWYYVRPDMITFIDEINLDDYEIKPFTLIDLFEKDPGKEMFLGFMEDWGFSPSKPWSWDKYTLSNFENLNKNIPWLIEKGFAVKKETNLMHGMRLECSLNNKTTEFIVTEDEKLCNLSDGTYWPCFRSTIEDLNTATEEFQFEIKK